MRTKMAQEELLPFEAERNPIVRIENGEAMADSRDVAAFFGKRNKDVNEAIKNLVTKDTVWGRRNFRPNYINDLSGSSISHHDMTRDGFMLLAMGFTGGRAFQWKLKYIAAFNAMEAQLRSRPADPMDLLIDPVGLRALLLGYTEAVLALEGEVEEMRPQVQAFDRIALSDGSLCITDAAKTLQIQPKVLFRFLRAHGWIYSRAGGPDIAYQDKIASGLMEHKTTTVHRSDGSERTATQARVTPKGLARLARECPPVARLVD